MVDHRRIEKPQVEPVDPEEHEIHVDRDAHPGQAGTEAKCRFFRDHVTERAVLTEPDPAERSTGFKGVHVNMRPSRVPSAEADQIEVDETVFQGGQHRCAFGPRHGVVFEYGGHFIGSDACLVDRADM
ncbi:MAG: hypothetical protein OXI95_08750 [bacterium]|nr:hypothetical protein [bacterium]